jgi:hypothetical protein
MSSDVLDVKALKKQYKSATKSKELEVFSEAQQKLIEQLQTENNQLKEKLSHLETVMRNSKLAAQRLSPEEIICMEQIEILKSKSVNRELSLDEVKRLDLLVKNLRLIREQSTQVINTGDYSTVGEDELVAIAAGTSENR